MNISGNQAELWKRLVAVGNDPYPTRPGARRRWSSTACSSRGTDRDARLLLAVAMLAAAPDRAALTEQVRQAEPAFAKTMADRDHAAFASFLADDTIFLGRRALRGKAAVAAAWKGFFEGTAALLVGAGARRGERRGHAGPQHRPRARRGGHADGNLQLDVAPRARRAVEDRLRQRLQLRAEGRPGFARAGAEAGELRAAGAVQRGVMTRYPAWLPKVTLAN